MAKSPFTKLANLTLLLQVPAGAETIGELGYPVVQVTPLLVIAFAKADGQAQRELLKDGELSRMVIKGRCVLPMQMPSSVQPDQRGQAVLWRITKPFKLPTSFANVDAYQAFVAANQSRIVMQGDFSLAPNLPGSVGVEEKVGDSLYGSLSVQVGWGDAL